ncbi:MAG TPA: LysE family translocator [Burkholderiaceae bacterium]
MNETAHLWLYFAVVFGIVALPGLDMAYVMGSALVGGKRAGFAAVAGIVAGGVCHMAMGVLGVAALLQLWPLLYSAMLAAGALYTAWIALAFLRAGPANGGAGALPSVAKPGAVFRRAMATSLINPKAYLFMLAIFPQFLKPAYGPLWTQTAALGLITWGTQAGVYGSLALAAGRAGGWFAGRPQAAQLATRVVGLLLLAVAVMTAAQLWN